MHSVRQLEIVRALAQHRHFGRAASALGVSQPALTRSLKTIEDELGVKLIDRPGVSPTVFGQIVIEHGGAVLNGFNALMREISLAKGMDIGELTVAAGPYPADISCQTAIGALASSHPKLKLKLSVLDWPAARDALAEDSIDLAVADLAAAASDPELSTLTLRTSACRLFCRAEHPLVGKYPLAMEDLLDYPWVGPSIPSRIGSALPQVDKAFGAFEGDPPHFRPRVLIETFSAAKSVVLAGNCIAAALPAQISREIDEGSLALLPIQMPWLQLNYGVISRRGHSYSPAAKLFIDNVREIERRI